MKSVMQHTFSRVPSVQIPRSTFDRSHGYKTTLDAGYLVPFLCDEALPGDTFSTRVTGFARLNTPIFPIMDNMFMDTHFFAVPMRLIWEHWQNFNGERATPDDTTEYTIPIFANAAGVAPGSISDYMGIPPGVTNLEFNSIFHRAYNLIWNEWFRDQNLQDPVVVDLDDGPDDLADYVLLRRGKRHDYFTSCLPWPQKGDSVDLPLGSSAPVYGTGQALGLTDGANSFGLVYRTALGGDDSYLGNYNTNVGVALGTATKPAQGSLGVVTSGTSGLAADLSSATAATVNQLRQSIQIQRMLERDARGGTRYTEIVRAHFGVISPDARLQRPEFLGGGSTRVNISPVPQTSSTDGTSPQGNLSGYGIAAFGNHGFTKSFTEHCLIIGLVSVRADLTYQQGLNRMFSRQTRYDFYWPSLSNIGEQAVLMQELYATGVDVADQTVFGYQERFAEYRYKPSLITGLLRSGAAGSLDSWHLSQELVTPVLDATFIVENPPVDRVVAVDTEPDFLFDSYISMRCARPMPVFGVPGLMDHF